MYKGLISDFDGTMHDKNRVISAPVQDALRRLTHAGFKFGFATGRQFDFIEPHACRFGEAHVVSGGACLVNSAGEVIRQHLIPAPVMRDVAEFIDQHGGSIVVKTHKHGYGNPPAMEMARSRPGLNLTPLDEIPTWDAASFYISSLPDEAWQVLLVRKDILLYKQRSRSGQLGFVADGVAPGVSKVTGIEWWCEYHNIRLEELVAIGDAENDLDMIEAAGLGLAVDNAVVELKTIADAVVPSLQDDGVAWAIKEYFKV